MSEKKKLTKESDNIRKRLDTFFREIPEDGQDVYYKNGFLPPGLDTPKLTTAVSINDVNIDEDIKDIEEKAMRREEEILNDLEYLLELSKGDAKKLKEELNSGDYRDYFDELMTHVEFSLKEEKRYEEADDIKKELEKMKETLLEKEIVSNYEFKEGMINGDPQKELNHDLSLSEFYAEGDFQKLLEKGQEYSRLKLFDNSLYYFDRGLELKPDSFELWANKGMTLFWMNKPSDAIKCINKSIEINPKDYKNWCKKGLVYKTQGKYEKALVCFSKSIRINPKFVNGWFEKAQVTQAMGNYEKAIRCYDKALEFDPGNLGASYYRELCLRVLRRAHYLMHGDRD